MTTRAQRTTRQSLWPECRGAMASLIRTGPWRVSPLGPIETWPQALKTTVEILLQGRQPAYVCWGRSLVTLYNDAAIPILGSRHPHSLGRPYPEIFRDSWDDLKPVIDAALGGEAQHIVGQRVSRGGEHPASWNTYTWTPLRDDTGRVAGLYCVATETSLQIGDDQLRTVLENTRDAVSMLNLASGKYVFISPSHTALTGLSEDELVSFTPADFFAHVHPDDIEETRHPTRGNGEVSETTAEFRWKVKSGEYRWFSVSRKPVRDAEGEPVAMVNVTRDITDRKRAELDIQASQATLEAALSSMTDAVYITDAEGRFLRANERFAAFHRFQSLKDCAATFDDFAERFDVYFPDCTPAPPENRPVPRALRGESAVGAEYSLVRKDTGEAWIGSYSFGPIRDPNGIIIGAVVTARDITEAKQAEVELLAGRAKLQAALNAMTDAVFISDEHGNFLHFNDAFATFHKFRSAAECAKTLAEYPQFLDVFLPDGTLASLEQWAVSRALRGESASGAEFTLRRTDTGESWIGSYTFAPIRDAYGNITGTVVTARDVTDAKAAAKALQASETRLSLAVDSAEMGTWEWDVRTDRAVWSAKLYEFLGLPPKPEEIGGTFFERVHPDDLVAVQQSLTDVINYGRDWRAEFRIVRLDGTERWLVGVGRLFRNDDGTPRVMFGVNYDISSHKQAEEDLRQSEAHMQSLKEQLMHVGRVSELSQVSAGIAHELNQPLAAMLNYSSTAKRLIDKKDRASIEEAALAIARAGEQALRAGTIIRRMRDFVEKRDTHQKSDDINAIVREAAELGLIGAKSDGIDVVLDLARDLPPVTADRIQIEQVLVNLLHNAMDAMANATPRQLTLSTRRGGRAVEVTVTDTGGGIPEQLAEKLFQPFVTTKEKGMGIGLAISRAIIEAHGGEISATSQGGKTVFRFTLPVA